jgi:hypothetical protein
MPLAADTSVLSAKLPATLLIVPVPATVVTAAKVMPWLLFAVSSKPTAPVTAVVSAAAKPAKEMPPAVPAVGPVRLNTVENSPDIDPPVEEVALPLPVGAVENIRSFRFVSVPLNVIVVPVSVNEWALASTAPSVQLMVPPPPPLPVVALTFTGPPTNAAARVAVVNVDVVSVATAQPAVKQLVASNSVVSGPVALIVRSVGSSSNVPADPRGALRSAVPPNAKIPLPETSTKPPFPPSFPPRAEIPP